MVTSSPTRLPLTQAERKALTDAAWHALGSVVVFIVSAVIWKVGADWTITFLKWLFNSSNNSIAWYGVSVLFSIAEVAVWKVGATLSPNVRHILIGMFGIDLLTTIAGLAIAVLFGQGSNTSYLTRLDSFLSSINIHTTVTAPSIGLYAVVCVIAVFIGYFITTRPERSAVEAALQVYETGRLMKLIFFRKGRGYGTP